MRHNNTIIAIITLLCVPLLNLGAQTADDAPHRDKDGNKIPWYVPDPDDGGTRATVDLRFAPTETKMIEASPAAAGATKYGDYGVSYALGLVDVSIPLYEIKSHSLTLPISLSYDSGGVRVDDVSGPVGLNWTLEAGGVITRTVLGRDDTDTYGWNYRPSGDPMNPSFSNYTYLFNLAFGNADNSADLYSYNFCGHRGSFYLDQSTVYPTGATDLIIEVTTGGFTITDTDGTKYNFTLQETSNRYTAITSPILGDGSSPQNFPQTTAPITAWYLTSIVAMDNTDRIDLSYTTYGTLTTVRYYKLRTYQFSYRYQAANNYLWLDSNGSWGGYPTVTHKTGDCQSQTSWVPKYVKTISYDGGEVEFNYTSNPIPSTSSTRQSYPYVLSSMTVKAKYPAVSSTTTVRTCTFSFTSTSDQRNLLTDVAITGKNGTAIESYSLAYINQSTGMPAAAKDLFGYYNGATTNNTTAFLRLFPDNSPFSEPMANRNYNSAYVSYLSLETVSTASGAKTRFSYEGNSISVSGTGVLFSTIGIGHRIRKIETFDRSSGSDVLVRQREFIYSSPGITIPTSAFTRPAFLTVTETFREDLAYGSPSWHGVINPVPRMATVAFSDQSVLPGAALESARIHYGSVTERVSSAPNSSDTYRTDYTFNTSAAVHPYSNGSWVLQSTHDTHDNTYDTGNANHVYHFFQRPPFSVPRQSGTSSVDLTQRWGHYYPADFPELMAPTLVRNYKRVGSSDVLVSQTAYQYDTTLRYYDVGIRSRDMIALGDGANISSQICHMDFAMERLRHRQIWHRLKKTTETEYLDDGASHSAVTSYTYVSTLSGIPTGDVILSPKTKAMVIDSLSTDPRRYSWEYTYPYEMGTTGAWQTLKNNGYRKPVKESVTAGTGSGSATTTRTETWASFSAKFATTTMNIIRPLTISTTRREPGGTTFVKGGPTITYSAYDCWGNPLQINVDGQPVTTYIWGYGGLKPVLEVAGGTYTQVSSAVGTNTLSAMATGLTTNSQLSGARTSLEAVTSTKMLVSWYLYNLPFGISVAADASGRLTNYSYDGAGRLSTVFDQTGNRVNSYAYALTNGGSGSPNSINTYTHTVAGSSATAGIRDVAYFDGLGRTVQTIAVGASTPTSSSPSLPRDLVTPVAPDFLDHEDAMAYLPYPAGTTVSNAGTYRSGALTNQENYYGSTVRAFTQNKYEISARNRIVESFLPGFADSTYVVTSGSGANTVRVLSFNASANTVSANGYYTPNRFTVTTTTGPDGSVTAVYTDEFGTPVLERVKIADDTWADTYYIKDVLGRVLCVVPPEEAAQFSSSSLSISAANCYTYRYDGRDRVTERQLPGTSAESISYNDADLPVSRSRLSADGTANEMHLITYDQFNRPTEEKYLHMSGSNSPVTIAEYWYDTYPSGAPGFLAETGYVTTYDSRVRGLKTAERFALLPAGVAPSGMTSSNTSAKEFRAFYYDAKGRVVQLARTNAQGGTDRTSSSYGFAGNLLAERQKIQPASGASTYNLDRAYTYDARLRLTNVTAALNGGSTASQAFAYNDLQQTASVSRGNSASETTTFSYTLQGWPYTTMSTSWEEVLFYATPPHNASGAAPGKAGLVTEWRQQQKGTSANGATANEFFTYSYDLAGRLLGSQRYTGTPPTVNNGLTEQGVTYDRNGNLTALTRRNDSGTATQTLSYTYTGPKRSGWTYDNHGNVTVDPQSGISVAWNAIDLPRKLTYGSAYTQRGYLADGTLAQIYDGSTTRLYLGDMVFTRSGTSGTPTLESAGWEGGRLINGSGTSNVLYYVTDHLGSVRVVKDGAGTIRQRFDYYPYGSVSRVYTNSSTTDNSVKRYRFGGKEIAGTALTDLAGTGAAPGAPYLDFGARLYSPGTATWLSVDPMAEKYYGIGPLTYCAGNPVNLVDYNGNEIRIVFEASEGRFQLRYDNDTFVYLDGTEYNGDDSFVLTVLSSLNALKKMDDPDIQLILSTLVSSERNHYIEYYPYNDQEDHVTPYGEYGYSLANSGIPVETRVFLKLNGGAIEDGLSTTNETTLGHELKHAYDFDQGKYKGILPWESRSEVNPAEISAVVFENKIRAIQGLPRRTSYGNAPIDKSLLIRPSVY